MSNSLASVHPELIPEWSERNLPLTPDKITFGSNKRVWWKGACGHEWETSVKARSKGEKCPICSGARVIEGINDLVTLKPLLAQEWSEKNKLKPTEVSVASHKKIIWKCKHGHEWEASVKSRTINGTGCPYCSHNKVLAGFNDLASQYPDIAAEWSDRNLPLLPTMVTAFANSKAWWKCRDCGNEWYTLISTRAGGSRCPYCSGYTLLKGFNDLATTHPDIAAEWSERNYPLMPDEVNAKSRHNVWWKCKTCGNEWKSVINARVKGTVCPVCADRTVLAGYNDLATTDRKLLAEWDYEKNSLLPTQVSRRSMKRVWWKCSLGHSWKAKISDRTIIGEKCTVCEKEYRSVFPGLAVAYYANQKGLKVQLGSDKLLGIPLETYIPSEKLAMPFEDDVAIICNEEGKMNGLPLNRAVYSEPENVEMSYPQLKAHFRQVEKERNHTTGYIVFTADSFDKPYTEEQRTYVVSSNNKAFIEGMGGYSIYASSLDGSDKCVRLEAYMADEHGGKDGWKIEKCYVKDDSNREMLDIIAGKFFIAYAPIESEKFLSMPKELARKYEEKFKYPERFYKSLDGIEAKPYKPVSKDMER